MLKYLAPNLGQVGSQVRARTEPGHLRLNQVSTAYWLCPWVDHFISLSLDFLSQKTGLKIVSNPEDVVGLSEVLTVKETEAPRVGSQPEPRPGLSDTLHQPI